MDVVLLPPTAGDQSIASDEEEDDDILDKTWIPNEVSGEVEVHEQVEEEDTVDEDHEAEYCDSQRWRRGERLSLQSHSLPSSLGEDLCGKEPYEIFKMFFGPDMIQHLTEQTNLYAVRDKNNSKFHATEEEICKFLGILLISGYHSLPSENDYWSTSEDLEAPVFRKTMSRDRFRIIKRYLHLADNSNLASSKMAKVLPLLEMLKKNCQQFGVFHEFLSIDESMIPYHGHHSAKQFIRSKPVRFGYKMWMLCGADGYPYNFSIYCGKEGESKTPLGTRVVNEMLKPVGNSDQYVVFFDNFFTSHALLTELAEKGFRACGTVRENRTGRCPLPSKKEVEKQDRGYFDYRSDGTVLCAKWHDSSVVTMASNYYGVNPLQTVERRVKKENKKSVNQPYLFKMYNKGMGGVDVCDRMLAFYRPRLRSKKWWWNIFSNILNLAVVAAFRFHQHTNRSQAISHLQFRREIARAMIKTEQVRKRHGGPSAQPAKAVRYDGVNHFLVSCCQGRCILCMKNTRLKCIKCDKRLHKACSEPYHKK